MYKDIRLNWRKYSRYFVNHGVISNEELMARNIYNLNEWLILSKYKDLTPYEYSALQLKIFGMFLKDFFLKDIYKDMEPTELAKKTIMNPVYMENNSIKKVYILSRNITEEQKESKEKFIKKHFCSPKVEFINVEAGEGKGDVMKKYNIDFDLFVDDELPNIRNVAEKFTNLDKKEFLIPKYGYNKMMIDIQALIEEKGGIITYYDPFKK